jgi:hypothetical protein
MTKARQENEQLEARVGLVKQSGNLQNRVVGLTQEAKNGRIVLALARLTALRLRWVCL